MTIKELSIDPKMTVKEVSEILKVSDRTVRRHAEKMGLTNNGTTTYLNETEVTKIKLSIERSGRNDLDNVDQLPQTNLEKKMIVQQAMMILNEEIKQLREQNIIMKPKADFYDQVTGSKDSIDMASVAKILKIKNVGRNKLFELLRDMKILQQNNQPYQSFVDRGYFRIIEQKFLKPNGDTSINIKTVVYQKGLDFIRKKVAF